MIRVHEQRILGTLHELSFFLSGGLLCGAALRASFSALGLSFVLFSSLLSRFVPLLLPNNIENFFAP